MFFCPNFIDLPPLGPLITLVCFLIRLSFLCSSSSQEHHSAHPALPGGPGGAEHHSLLPNHQLPSISHGPKEADKWHRAILYQRHLPTGQRHSERLWALPGQRDKRPGLPGQGLQHQGQWSVAPTLVMSPSIENVPEVLFPFVSFREEKQPPIQLQYNYHRYCLCGCWSCHRGTGPRPPEEIQEEGLLPTAPVRLSLNATSALGYSLQHDALTTQHVTLLHNV